MTLNSHTRRIVQLLELNPEMGHADIARQVSEELGTTVDRRRVYQVQKYIEANGFYREFDAMKLILARAAKDWSLRKLAREAGVSPSQVSRWERRRSVPRVAEWKKVATALGIQPADLRKKAQ